MSDDTYTPATHCARCGWPLPPSEPWKPWRNRDVLAYNVGEVHRWCPEWPGPNHEAWLAAVRLLIDRREHPYEDVLAAMVAAGASPKSANDLLSAARVTGQILRGRSGEDWTVQLTAPAREMWEWVA